MTDYDYEMDYVIGEERERAFLRRYNSLHPRDPQRWDMEEEAEILMGDEGEDE
jgi:hypothetical protein